jgi:LuxR family maltose regulon positive regulatory protein
LTESNNSMEAGMLIQTKLLIPRVVTELVERPHLIDRLNHGLKRDVTLISAPAGYGKSTLAAAWLKQLSRPTAWISLDEQDNELAHFLTYLIGAIHSIYPQTCVKTASLLKAAELPPVDYLATSLINELTTVPQFLSTTASQTGLILVLDDYHVLNNPSVHNFMSKLIAYQPPGLNLVLICRKDPTHLPLVKLRAGRKLLEIRLKGLRFDLNETQTFLRQIAGLTLPDEVITILAKKTEGWVLGLHLASLSLRNKMNPTAFVQALQGTDRYMMEFFLDEVLASQPVAIQNFLLKTSILGRFCGPLCEIVTDLDDPTCNGQAYLEWLEQINLFVISLDNEAKWYRFHHLFRDLLFHKLMREYTVEEVNDLHRRASRWLADLGDLETAISHALQADDPEMAARIIEDRRQELMLRENWPLLSRLLHSLPQPIISQRPVLLVMKAWERRTVADYSAVDSILDRAEAELKVESDLVDETVESELQGEIAWLRTCQLFYSGDFEQSIAFCHQAYEHISPERPLYAIVRQTEAFSLQGMGLIDQAKQLVQQAMESHLEQTNANLETDWYTLFAVNYLAGEWVEAERVAQNCISLFSNQQENPVLNAAFYVLGAIYYEWNDVDRALHYFGLVAKELVYDLTYQDAFFCLALCYQVSGNHEKAIQLLNEIESFIGNTRRAHLLLGLEAVKARIALMSGNNKAAILWANSVILGPPSIIRIYLNDPHLIQAQAWIAKATDDSLTKAHKKLEAMLMAAEKTHNEKRKVEAITGQALAFAAQGDQKKGLDKLKQALRLAQPQGFIRTFVDYGPALVDLLLKIQTVDSDQKLYKQQLLSAFGIKTVIGSIPVAQPLADPLTNRELEILSMLARRQAYKEIAAALIISVDTVKTHVSNIYRKLEVNRRQEAVAKARSLNLLGTLDQQL